MKYDFLVDTYETECIKLISVWSEFEDEDLSVRPRQGDPRGRSAHEQMVHYAYPSLDALFKGEAAAARKAVLPGASDKPVTERPASG